MAQYMPGAKVHKYCTEGWCHNRWKLMKNPTIDRRSASQNANIWRAWRAARTRCGHMATQHTDERTAGTGPTAPGSMSAAAAQLSRNALAIIESLALALETERLDVLAVRKDYLRTEIEDMEAALEDCTDSNVAVLICARLESLDTSLRNADAEQRGLLASKIQSSLGQWGLTTADYND